jgi:hypothetical protein
MAHNRFRWTGDGTTPSSLMRRAVCGMLVPSRAILLIHTFQKVSQLPCIALVAAGCDHSAAIDTEGGLWVWASNDALSWASFLPRRVEGLPPIIKVACAFHFLVAEAQEGPLWVLADNSHRKAAC